MTGRYASSVGMPGAMILSPPFGLGRNYSTIAEELRVRGYHTSLVGKWHLGQAKKSYHPLQRGFDDFYGIYTGSFEHYSKFVFLGVEEPPQTYSGYDLHDGYDNVMDSRHATELFASKAIEVIRKHKSQESTQPLFLYFSLTAPHYPLTPMPEHLAKCQHMKTYRRRDFCGLVVGADEAIKNVTDALKAAAMWDDTILVFTTDNGGMPFGGARNYPYRGSKSTAMEGGSHVPAFAYSPNPAYFNTDQGGREYSGMVHVADWLPTLLSLVDGEEKRKLPIDIDGMDMSEAIRKNSPSPRTEAVITIDVFQNVSALRSGKWKIIVGHRGDDYIYFEPKNDSSPLSERQTVPDLLLEWAFETFKDIIGYHTTRFWNLLEFFKEIRVRLNMAIRSTATPMHPRGIYLYDLDNDVSESINVADANPEVVNRLLARLDEIKAKMPRQKDWRLMDPIGFSKRETAVAMPSISETPLVEPEWNDARSRRDASGAIYFIDAHLDDDVDEFDVPTWDATVRQFKRMAGQFLGLVTVIVILPVVSLLFLCRRLFFSSRPSVQSKSKNKKE